MQTRARLLPARAAGGVLGPQAIQRASSCRIQALLTLLLPLLLTLLLPSSISFTLSETTDGSGPAAVDQSSASSSSSHHVISSACKEGLDFKTIGEFRAFLEEFKSSSEEELRADPQVAATRCPKYRQAILDLEPLIVQENVCDVAQIDALVQYHTKYFKSARRLFGGLGGWGQRLTARKPPLTRRFFAKYAIQVAHTCKLNLVKNLETSRELLQEQAKSLEEAKERVFNERPSLKMNLKLIEEQPDAPAATNVKPKSETELTLGEYREALTRLKRPEDILTFERAECEGLRNRRVEIAADKVQMFFKPALVCLKLAQYYSSSVLSIARLANYGYLAPDEELDLKLADSALVKDWIVATQVCEPMLYMRTDKIENEVATVDTCSERVVALENMVFEDNIGELYQGERLDEWLVKSEATRHQAQKIMKSAMRKLAKVSLMRELKQAGGLKKRNMFSTGIKGALKSATAAASASGSSSLQADMLARSRQVSQHLMRGAILDVSALRAGATNDQQPSDARSFETLMRVMSEEGANEERKSEAARESRAGEGGDNDEANSGGEGAVSMFDPLTTLASSITIIAIMLTFEWLFFVVMTLAARICHQLNFNFDNLLTFPPKVLSWSDADFAQYTDSLEKIDEDDFFDYDELNPEEQKQRDLLAKVFGKPPPLLFKE